jgi:hypothetical protein
MTSVTGGCLCGRVRYAVTGEPVFSGLCHCRNCQRYTGSSFEAVIAFPTASVSVRGELKPITTPVTPASRYTEISAQTVDRG